MTNYNKVMLIGTLTRDPESRTTPGGVSVTKFSLAINRKFTGKDGSKKEETVFVEVDSFAKPAELIAKHSKKGSQLLVEGRLKLDQWESKDGEKKSRLGVVLEEFQFVGGKKE